MQSDWEKSKAEPRGEVRKGNLHRWRARIMVASVSEWHLWIRWGSLETAAVLLLFPTLWSKLVNTGRSSLSSFRLLFSCCWTAESTEDEGSLLLNGGPPTYIPKQSDQITTIITTICSGMEKYRGWRGVSLYPTQSLLSDFLGKKEEGDLTGWITREGFIRNLKACRPRGARGLDPVSSSWTNKPRATGDWFMGES